MCSVICFFIQIIIQKDCKHLLFQEEYYDLAHTDGHFQGKKYFDCPSNKGFFVNAKTCKPDNRFLDNSLLAQPSKGMDMQLSLKIIGIHLSYI